jgi:hypothetical protein
LYRSKVFKTYKFSKKLNKELKKKNKLVYKLSDKKIDHDYLNFTANMRYLNFKRNQMKKIYNFRYLNIINKMSKRRFFNSKFLTILLLKGRKRLLAKIKKLKKNSSFNRALKFNR